LNIGSRTGVLRRRGADMLFVRDRRRSSRIPSAIRSERSEPLNIGSRTGVLRRRGADMLFVRDRRRSSRIPSAIRSERSGP